MPHFNIKLLDGISEVQKQKLTLEIIKAAQNVIGFGEESYSVTIEDFTLSDWENDVYPNDIMGKKEIIYKKPGYKI